MNLAGIERDPPPLGVDQQPPLAVDPSGNAALAVPPDLTPA